MRILDRYAVRQLLPVWVWCLLVFIFLTCLVDLFGHLDEILRYRVPSDTVLRYYAHFAPIVLVRASPLALLLGAAFVATRLSRHQEFMAMNASGLSLLRASVPFLFVGWLASLCAFVVNERVVPRSTIVYEQIREEAFRGRSSDAPVENVAIMDTENRLYHARALDLKAKELLDLTVLEHDRQNQPVKNLYASRAVWTKHGWLLLYGMIYRVGPKGVVLGTPEQFVERVIPYPVTVASFIEPESRPDTMRYANLRRMIIRLKQTGKTNVRRYVVELASKLSLPLTNLVVCLIAFVGSAQPELRGQLRGLGTSLGWGLLYYVVVGIFQGIAKEWPVPIVLTVWLPHVAAVWWCVRKLKTVR